MTDVTRRGFLLGGLAGAVTITAAGTTGLLVRPTASWAAMPFAIDVTGSYQIRDTSTGCVIDVRVRKGVRVITANGLPNHATGAFPNAHNPNSIRAQVYEYELPTSPTKTSKSTYNVPQPFGIAINGVIFDPYAAEWWRNDRSSGWQKNALSPNNDLGLDSNHAHVQPSGAYHYHGIPDGLVATLDARRHSPLLGWAGDGFPIYLSRGYKKAKDAGSGVKTLTSGWALKKGSRQGGPGGSYDGTYEEDYAYDSERGDLDKANGRFQVTPEYPNGTYCYILSSSYPVIPRRFVAPIASSFVKSGGPPMRSS